MITFSNNRQYWSQSGEYWCVGNHELTVEIHNNLPAFANFIEGEPVTVHYDPNNPDFGVMIMPEFSGLYLSIGAIFAVYVIAVYTIFNHEPKPKGEEETSLTNPHSRSNWWEAQT